MKNVLYEKDFVQWTEEQTQHLQKQELDTTILVRDHGVGKNAIATN